MNRRQAKKRAQRAAAVFIFPYMLATDESGHMAIVGFHRGDRLRVARRDVPALAAIVAMMSSPPQPALERGTAVDVDVVERALGARVRSSAGPLWSAMQTRLPRAGVPPRRF